ncbi:MAG: hypothetical protein JJU24_19440 [Natronohydrobacter sp.]|nr:hypothetical protein [Natronohydrobacter sp.]
MRLFPSRTESVLQFRIRAVLRRLGWRIADRIRPPRPQPAPPVPRKPGPLRVGFVVSVASKWALQSVLSELQAREDVTCGFYPTLSDLSLRYDRQARRADYATQRAFFAARAPVWADLYDPETDRMQPLSNIDCDIVFIQQPWGMQDLPRRLAGRVRAAYVHYGLSVISNDRMHYGLPDFHPFLWRYFVPTPLHAQAVQTIGRVRPQAVRVVGHPKLDAYRAPPPARAAVALWARPHQPERKRIIYAPHHALGPNSLRLGTFAWSGPAMLALAERSPDVDFLLRPHPNLGHALARSGIMSAAQWQAYLEAWRSGGNTSLSLDEAYFDLFRSSDALITDSGSFLAEYLPTGQSLIRLTRPDSAPLNSFGMALSAAFCEASDPQQLEGLFQRVLRAPAIPGSALPALMAQMIQPGPQSTARQILTQCLDADSGRDAAGGTSAP